MSKKFLLLSVMLIGMTAAAQDSSNILDPVVLSATKTPTKQSGTGKVIQVISQEELQKNVGNSLGEVLNRQAGLTIGGSNNAMGTNQSVYTRGAHSSNTLILLDGVPLYDPSGETTAFDINNFSLQGLERIEILKGSQSTLYGSDAVAGVINLISKKSGTSKNEFNGSLAYGSYKTFSGSAAANGNGKGYSYNVSYDRIDSKGFSSANDSTGNKNFDKDGFSRDAAAASFSLNKEKNYEAKIYGRYNINHFDIDAGAFADDKDFTNKNRSLQAGTSLEKQIKKSFLHLNYNYNWYDRDFKDDSISRGSFAKYQKGNYTGYSHFAELYGDFPLGKKANILVGTDYRHNSTDQNYMAISGFGAFSSPALDHHKILTRQNSVYSSLVYKDKGLTIEGGGRYNHHNIYGKNATFSFNPSYLTANRTKIFSNISSGFRAPSLYQLYSEFGNKDLKPEESVSYELGVQQYFKGGMARVTGFKRNIHDVFYFYTNPITYVSQYKNEDKQKDHGVEAELEWKNESWSIAANYSFVDGKISTKDFNGKDTTFYNLFRRPKNTFNLTVGYSPLKALYVSAHARVVSKSLEGQFYGPPVKLKGYCTVDLYVEYQVHQKIKFFLDLKNITDQKYFDVLGFNAKRFNVNGGVVVRL